MGLPSPGSAAALFPFGSSVTQQDVQQSGHLGGVHGVVLTDTPIHAVADELEGELGEERPSFIYTCQRDREELPRPDLPIIVGLDGGYVHSSQQRSRADGWFEVIAGKAIPAAGRASCFGYVQTYDTKP